MKNQVLGMGVSVYTIIWMKALMIGDKNTANEFYVFVAGGVISFQ